MKKGIVTILLLLLLIGAAASGAAVYSRYNAQKAQYEGLVAEAQAELVSVSGEILTPEEAEARRLAQQQDILARAEEETNRLTEENAGLDASIAAAEQNLAEAMADEDYEYYKAAYDSFAKGRAEVESYLN